MIQKIKIENLKTFIRLNISSNLLYKNTNTTQLNEVPNHKYGNAPEPKFDRTRDDRTGRNKSKLTITNIKFINNTRVVIRSCLWLRIY